MTIADKMPKLSSVVLTKIIVCGSFPKIKVTTVLEQIISVPQELCTIGYSPTWDLEMQGYSLRSLLERILLADISSRVLLSVPAHDWVSSAPLLWLWCEKEDGKQARFREKGWVVFTPPSRQRRPYMSILVLVGLVVPIILFWWKKRDRPT